MSTVWAMGSPNPANTSAMGGSAATLNQVTPEEEEQPLTEEEELKLQEIEEQKQSPDEQLQQEEIEQNRYDVVPDQ
ncbi:hypothetical protein [Peredibacter starrii]|uniref:Uncharacterized protein n=1 Tax=Peredibacter starrii TaxID=28202 RepID=A0AAX4HUC9_9BACT|nr:hypothetical protein [Peredibacter starrii]WPU66979.1 hypothetical protein SOO65_09470 [Peredibacter starrii]